MLAYPADGQKPGWDMNSERMGSPRERVCEAATSRAHMFVWGTPQSARFAFGDAQGDVMAARVVGIRQEGVNPCRMVPSMRDEVHVQLHDVTGKVQGARP